ncbi:hypothetical protein SAMN05444365_11362 [Micromonospora pattaloongensis]|uniref:4-amino-4-deoxy-L-arabinose transferase n=1 Tax=Micromonospora pattaloongensis TaxID=405436 RepID=A0A1H3SQS0_9ACTN|nr:hypothetical protein [Micromonospora pattaloongensis]SDZ40294.1 hypothetical protein SAMN05444365_11362 [Micromonospora pattaloongensis]
MTATLGRAAAPDVAPTSSRHAPVQRWLPLVAGLSYVAAVLLAADTAPLDLLRYAGYVAFALLLPGTLVYRALRRRPHTLVEDLAMGAAVGLVLELPAWALFSVLDLRGWLWLWPLAVVGVFAVVPRLRRHWVVRGYTPAPLGWSWSVAGVVAFFTTYLGYTFLERNPILPTSHDTRQYLDLAYQLSLAGEAKHQFPIHVPQVAAEPLHYHWFGYAHMAATSLIGHIDLPVVALRLAVPALCAAAIVLTAVLGWRVSGRPYVGAIAAALFFVIGETNFTHPVTMPFGTQASFVIWHGMSMIYSWVLLIALVAALADVVDRRPERPVPSIGPGAFVLAALLMFASSGAKASSVPVVAVALAITAVALLIAQRRIPWAVVVAGVLAGAAQLFATAVLYHFKTYGVQLGPFWSFERFWAQPPAGWARPVLVVAVVAAFVINMQLRAAGAVALLTARRWRLEPVQWFLLAGAVAGPGLYLLLEQSSDGNQYFTRAGFTFTVVVSAWGYALAVERARLGRRGRWLLGGFAAALGGLLVLTQLRHAPAATYENSLAPLLPLLRWALLLGVAGLVGALIWAVARPALPALRGRGPVVVLTALLVVGAPGLVMDMYKSAQSPNGGAYATVPLPASRVEAARWTREHSAPSDVVATNVHCLAVYEGGWCDPRSFWLSAYAERRVLVEGWAFAPRVAALGLVPFWDQELLGRNDAAFTAPTEAGLRELRERHGVRWLVVDRSVGVESPELPRLARLGFDNGRMAVYELR